MLHQIVHRDFEQIPVDFSMPFLARHAPECYNVCGKSTAWEVRAKMAVTILATVLIMAAYFLVLYGAVGLLGQKIFGSAPKENLAAIPDKKERFPGAHVVGWIIEVIAVLMFLGAAVLGRGGRHKKSFQLFSILWAISGDAVLHGNL